MSRDSVRNPPPSGVGRFKEIRKRLELPALIDELGLKKGVEIGVHQGDFSAYLLENSKLEILHSVDAWSDDTDVTGSVFRDWALRHSGMSQNETIAREKLAGFGERSRVTKSLSVEAAKLFADDELDFVYIDASHRFCGVALDLMAWWPKVKWGGIFSGHDYWRAYRCEVMEAVNGFLVEHKQILHITTDDTNNKGRRFFPSTWWTVKKERTKGEYQEDVKAQAGILLDAQVRLRTEAGISVVLPYQYKEACKDINEHDMEWN